GEIGADLRTEIKQLVKEKTRRSMQEIDADVIGVMLLGRLVGVITVAGEELVLSTPAEKGRDLLKQVRTHLIETARPIMEKMVEEVTGARVVSLHHDISTVTGEEVVLFALAEAPSLREAKKR